jgi:sulfate permease, SulP family
VRALASLRRFLPSRSDYAGLSTSWRGDVMAGVTVGIVALPLALAFGITTGLGADVGLVTAIVAGLVAAVFGGSNVQVSGPTGAMAVVLVPIVHQYGRESVFVVGLMAGVLIVAAALCRLGRLLAYMPWPVIEGFTIGIAVIILLQQVPAVLGVPRPDGENAALVAGRAVIKAFGSGHAETLMLVALVVTIMFVLSRVHQGLPGSLLAVVGATALTELVGWEVPRIGSLPGSLPMPALPSVSMDTMSALFSAAFAVAALAALESLLSAKVADGMADTGRHDPDRELFGQGLANLVTPLFGGMPATGAIARTAVNVRAGGRTRVSALVHSLVLVVVVFVGGDVIAQIPLAALAGVLIVTAVRMVDVQNVRAVVRSTRSDAIVLALTAVATVAFDLILAVELGVVVAVGLALRKVARSSSVVAEQITADDVVDGDTESALLHEHIVTYRLDGALFFGAAQRFLTELSDIGAAKVVILRLPQLQMLDATGAQALAEIVTALERRGVTVLIKGPRPEHLQVLGAVGVFDHLAHEAHVFETLDDAVAHARLHVRRRSHDPAMNVGQPAPDAH